MATLSTNDIKIRYDIDLTKLQEATSQFDKITAEERALLRELGKLKKELDDVGDKAKKAGKDTKDSLSGLDAIASKVAPAIAGIFAADKVIGFAKEVIAVTAEFQKLSAVLTNTLGSRSAAAGAMTRIQEFAAQTPFSVQELTASFVKLSNQGFTPTVAQLKKLGDLASSTGKGFDQLAEAIIDAQTGEFERLKEFGVRASKAGDQVTFTFKGVQTQVKFTNEAIREYLVSLGDLKGVSGAMAAISGTLGGQISNLGDAWDSLLNTIGTNLAPIYQKALGATSTFLTQLNNLFGGKQIKEAGEQYNKLFEKFSQASPEALKNLKANAQAQIKANEDRLNSLKKTFAEESKQSQIIREEYRAAGQEYDDIQQQSITTSRTVTAEQISQQERLLKAYQLNLDVFTALYEQKTKNNQVDDQTTKQIKDEYNARLKLIELEKQQLILLAQIRGSKAGEIGAEKIFAQAIYDLKKEYSEKNIGITEQEIEVARISTKVKEQEFEKASAAELMHNKTNLDIFKQNRDEIDNRLKLDHDAGIARMKEWSKNYEQNLKDQEKALEESEKAKQAIREKAFELGQVLVSGAFDLYQANLSNELTLLQKRYDEESRLAADNRQKKTELEEKFREEERAIKLKQFRAEQLSAIANIAFAAAPEIVKYAVLAPPLAALIAAIAAAQVTMVLAQPVPEFAEGTKGKPFKGGKAIVGERGVEKVVTESGKVYFTPPTATLVDLPKGAQVIPNHALKKEELFLANHYENKATSTSTSPVLGKLDELGSILKGLPIHQIQMDERGFQKYIRTPSRSSKVLNNKFPNSFN